MKQTINKTGNPIKTVKVFMNGQSQAIRIPYEFRSSTKIYQIEKENGKIILTPQKIKTWNNFLSAVDAIPENNGFSIPEDNEYDDNHFMDNQ